MEELEKFPYRLKEVREQLEMTQKEFCDFIGIRQQSLSGYETGKMKPPLDVLAMIAKKTNISLDWLCGFDVQKSNSITQKTYTDVIRLMVEIEKVIKFDVLYREKKIKVITSDGLEHLTNRTVPMISINDSVIQEFLNEWSSMLQLVHKGTIKQKLYDLWIDDQLKQYNFLTTDEDAIREFFDIKKLREGIQEQQRLKRIEDGK